MSLLPCLFSKSFSSSINNSQHLLSITMPGTVLRGLHALSLLILIITTLCVI